jgi:hypothetical protein
MAEITDQQLIDAATDAVNYAAVINGPANAPNVVMRSGTSVPTLAYQAANMAKGDTGAPGPSATPVAAIIDRTPASVNLVNYASFVANSYIDHNNGSLLLAGGFYASDFIPVDPNTLYTTNQGFAAGNDSSGWCEYDDTFAPVVPHNTPVAPMGTFTTGATTGFIRFTLSPFAGNGYLAYAQSAQHMVVKGNVMPPTFVSFYGYAANIIDAKDAAVLASAVSSIGAITTDYVDGFLGGRPNLFDPTKTLPGLPCANGTIDNGNGPTFYYANIRVIGGRTYYLASPMGNIGSNTAYGLVWLDINNAVCGFVPIPFTQPQAFVAPVNAVRALVPGTTDNNSNYGPQMFVVDALPGTYEAYPRIPLNITLAGLLPTFGKKFAVFGDSISSIFNQVWQNVVIARLGVSLVYQDAAPGRNFANLFESYGITAPSQALGNYDGAAADGVGNAYFNAGKVQGQSFATNINNAAPDFGYMRLGTNDQLVTTGALGDWIAVGTTAGNMRYDIDLILNARPTLRMFGVGPTWNGFGNYAQLQAIDAIEQTVYEFYSIPYLSMLKRGGGNVINNSTFTGDSNSPSYTLTDPGNVTTVTTSGFGTHPSNFAQANVDGPALANFAALYL